MKTATAQDHDRVISHDALQMRAQARERLAHGVVRDAAENAWCAVKRATDTLVLARIGEESPSTYDTTQALLAPARQSYDCETLVSRYFTKIRYLHGTCFYSDICGPDVERRVIETVQYIADAERPSGG